MRQLKSAILIYNPTKPHAKALAGEVRRFLTTHGARVVREEKSADALITVSGDGTLLYHKSRYNLPIFAIGNENSAICQAKADNWKRMLSRILQRGFTTERRGMLSCEAGGKVVEDALNEVVIRSRDHRVIDILLGVNGKKFKFLADGVLFSTPTGSTAYCYSCGGRKLPVHARKYEAVAIAPYRRAFRPMVLKDSAICAASTQSRAADLVFDGQFIHRMSPGSRIRVFKSRRAIHLIKT